MSEAKWAAGPYRLELVRESPFGVKIWAGEKVILSQDAYCFASGQKTRHDNEMGLFFSHRGTTTPDAAQAAIAEQDATARLLGAAPELYDALELVWDTYGMDPSVDSSIWQTVRAALAKARGEGAE